MPSESDTPSVSSSASVPSFIGGLRTSLPQHDFTFRSDASSVLSSSSAQAPRVWFCGSCSYSNSDMYHTTCALCGRDRCFTTTGTASGISVSGAATVSSKLTSGRHTIFTLLDSGISFANSHSSNSNRSLSGRSVTSSSRTVGTGKGNTPKATLSFADRLVPRPSNHSHRSGLFRRHRCEDREEDGSNQPPVITRANSYGKASQVTCRRLNSDSTFTSSTQSLSFSQVEIENESADFSQNSPQSRRKIVPHEDPTEMQPRHGRRHRLHHYQQQEDLMRVTEAKTLYGTDEDGNLTRVAGPVAISTKTEKGKKKRTLKDYIPGLRRRRNRRELVGWASTTLPCPQKLR